MIAFMPTPCGACRAQAKRTPGGGAFLPEERSLLKARLEKEDPIFGDRHIELTLIGLRSARDAFAAALRTALCTDDEVAAWQRGETFPDPWPKTLRRAE